MANEPTPLEDEYLRRMKADSSLSLEYVAYSACSSQCPPVLDDMPRGGDSPDPVLFEELLLVSPFCCRGKFSVSPVETQQMNNKI